MVFVDFNICFCQVLPIILNTRIASAYATTGICAKSVEKIYVTL